MERTKRVVVALLSAAVVLSAATGPATWGARFLYAVLSAGFMYVLFVKPVFFARRRDEG